MNSDKKNKVLPGIGYGFGAFLLLAALCLLTPLRVSILQTAGLDIPALQGTLQMQRDSIDALQMRASESRLSPAERAALNQVQEEYAAARERLDTRRRLNARLSLFGLFDAVRELFPWLLAFGLAFPVLGGLIGAQATAPARRPVPTGTRRDPAQDPMPVTAAPIPPPAPPIPPPPPQRPVLTTPVPGVAPPVKPGAAARSAYVHPAAAAAASVAPATPTVPVAPVVPAAPAAPPRPTAGTRVILPGSPVVLPPGIAGDATEPPPVVEPAPPAPASVENRAEETADAAPQQEWGFRHQPTPLESRPRTKLPPVRSPHVLDGDELLDESEKPLAG